MRFLLDDEQAAFARSLDALLTASDTPSTARAWSTGNHAPGLALWSRLAEAGVFGLAIPEPYEGVGPLPVELMVAFVELGRHAVPGPLVETVAAAALLTRLAEQGDASPAKRMLPPLASGDAVATMAAGAGGLLALDADAATVMLVVEGAGADAPSTRDAGAREVEADATYAPVGDIGTGTDGHTAQGDVTPGTNVGTRTGADAPSTRDAGAREVEADATYAPVGDIGTGTDGRTAHGGVTPGGGRRVGARAGSAGASPNAPRAVLRLAPGHGPVRSSLDPVRRLAEPAGGGEVLAEGAHVADAFAYAADVAALVTAAQALGVGLALLDRTVAYVKQRTQFGTAIGSFPAVKHRLADTLIGLEFARPLLYGAALSMAPADIAAAKVTAGEAAYAAARTALQLHGAVGYTDELDLSLWLRKARPLRDAWGTPAQCRARVLGA
ncbi:acyl-CoA/acyl-ACP dehydrogenase [Streptomyces sp. ISL-1]|uniref:acyl-CoA dehydrogenase family protein n=1 Tax=Streptomyces sp. ISL-1 TaxID=2817657 RepID=UPI001BE920C5|nr:acyl-CoA dehydrogenase family protein [Streptomyces sp. ISL-1]MBT2392882.1 acyl-CoA/acyl-ACP dehydrogenase [Streptomyces sp. ISL-1]